MSRTILEVRKALKRYGSRDVLREISLNVMAGEFLTILGESGSGKTTLLRLIAGFEKLDGGEIHMDGERIDPLPPFERKVNTVFQQYALFPHLSVFENVAYGLRIKRVAPQEIKTRVEQALALVRMETFASRATTTLSGGQQQRIALARAVVNRPKLLLLDEPLSALDAHLRRQMQGELKALQRELGITFIFVTHDQEEAMAMSDRVALLRAGILEQLASPREIYSRPLTAYTAQFIGDTNLIRLELPGETAPVLVSIRPERVRPAGPQRTSVIQFQGKVRAQTYEGATELLEIFCSNGRVIRARVPAQAETRLDSEVAFEFDASDAVRIQESP
jgi:spermidine/putrescine transport system ATP-binding protein